MQQLRNCIQEIIDVYGVAGLRDEKCVRRFVRQNPCGGEACKALLLCAVRYIPELARSGAAKADIPAAILAKPELAPYKYSGNSAAVILQQLTEHLYEAPVKVKPDAENANIKAELMREAMQKCLDAFGPEILLDKTRFKAAILDLLPNFSDKVERDWLFISVDMLNLGSILLKAHPASRAAIYKSTYEKLVKRGVSAETSDAILQAFTGALNWNVPPIVPGGGDGDEDGGEEGGGEPEPVPPPPGCTHSDVGFISRTCRLCGQKLYGLFEAGKFTDYGALDKEESGEALLSVGDYAGTLVLPERLRVIGDYAFSKRKKLLEVIFPAGLTSIGKFAFEGCSSLKVAELPDSVQSIGMFAFSGCSDLRFLKLPSALRSIEEGVFSGCSELVISVPDSVVSISETAFSGVKQVIYSGPAAGAPWGAQKCSKETSASDNSEETGATDKTLSRKAADSSSAGSSKEDNAPSEAKTLTKGQDVDCGGSSAPPAAAPVQSGRNSGVPKAVYIAAALFIAGIIAFLVISGSGDSPKQPGAASSAPKIAAEQAASASAPASSKPTSKPSASPAPKPTPKPTAAPAPKSQGDEVLAAAKNGDAEAQYKLGNRYYSGNGAVKNLNEAVNWYRKAVHQGHVGAKYKMGLCYSKGLGGLKKDYDQAVSLWKQAQKGGSQEAAQALADIQKNADYQYSLGQKLDKAGKYSEALAYYDKAAKQGHAKAKADAADLRAALAPPPAPPPVPEPEPRQWSAPPPVPDANAEPVRRYTLTPEQYEEFLEDCE